MVKLMEYYPRRRTVGILGFISFAVSIILAYQYLVTSNIAYAIFDMVAIGFVIFLLMPFFRNQIVDVVGKSIVVQTFGRKNVLTVDNLDSICRSNDGATSYRFSEGGHHYQVTPNVDTNSQAMLEEFSRIFDNRSKRLRKKH